MGAVTTQAPELFKAVLCGVPLLDMVRYHKFGVGSAWITEYGSAEEPEQFKTLYAYSPYHHVRQGTKYPALLMLSSDHDDRVDPMHARKFTAALQWATASGAPVWLRIEQNAGHGGADVIRQQVDAWADRLAFLMQQVGQ
jgi:prolyl oligopeptidase